VNYAFEKAYEGSWLSQGLRARILALDFSLVDSCDPE
jgi:hypothetical protein